MIPKEEVELPVSLSMNPYTGEWSKIEAAHLLRRCLFGPTYQQIVGAENTGLEGVLSSLLTTPNLTLPLTFNTGETVASQGQL
jgi:hypothetical protein